MHKMYFNWYCILTISWIIGEKKVRNSAVFCKERFIYFDHPFKVAECNSLHQAFIAALKIAVKGVQNDLNPSLPLPASPILNNLAICNLIQLRAHFIPW